MPISFPQLRPRTLPLAAALLGLVFAARGAQTPAPSPTSPTGRAPIATNAAPAEPALPKSVFHVPISPQDPMKDPFFPKSTRRMPIPAPLPRATNLPPPEVVVELELKGISGAADRRFAIINSRTFGTGEEGEVPAGSGRARIRVVEIKNDSVVVEVDGKQRVLRLRSGL